MDRNQAYVDPDAIDEAARTLDGFVCRVRDFENRLGHELGRLGITFQDDAYEQFCASFQQTRKLILEFADQTSTVIPQMRDDVVKIRIAQSLKPNA